MSLVIAIRIHEDMSLACPQHCEGIHSTFYKRMAVIEPLTLDDKWQSDKLWTLCVTKRNKYSTKIPH